MAPRLAERGPEWSRSESQTSLGPTAWVNREYNRATPWLQGMNERSFPCGSYLVKAYRVRPVPTYRTRLAATEVALIGASRWTSPRRRFVRERAKV